MRFFSFCQFTDWMWQVTDSATHAHVDLYIFIGDTLEEKSHKFSGKTSFRLTVLQLPGTKMAVSFANNFTAKIETDIQYCLHA